MDNNEILLTQEGLEELKNEIDDLKVNKRKEVAEKIKEALAFGDISENSEYDEAKNEQADIERRIAKLENMIKNARIIQDNDDDSGIINVGSRVKVEDLEFNEEMEYKIVGSAEADPFKGKISNVSPLGKNLIGKKPGETVAVPTPDGGTVEYKIININ
ncbi:MAG TPA: transcription elongation factor GreA [Clostridiales bacterium]|jgi:transcription elongation factor GreA|nr:transcription elongation factor GreA [Clostridiales bacterium]